jgi:hypothetical protein
MNCIQQYLKPWGGITNHPHLRRRSHNELPMIAWDAIGAPGGFPALLQLPPRGGRLHAMPGLKPLPLGRLSHGTALRMLASARRVC